MIKNEKQYYTTKKRLQEFEEQLKFINKQEGLDPLERELDTNALLGFIDEFKQLIEEYEALKNRSVSFVLIDSLSKIPEALIKGRICAGLTHADLASKLQLPPQQIQRYEACNYMSASLERLQEVALAVGVSFSRAKVNLCTKPLDVSEETCQSAHLAAQKLNKNMALMRFE